MIEMIHLDLNIVEHCNFSCANCSHLSPLHKPWKITLEQIQRDLMILKPLLTLRTVNVVGGEPTLHPQLLDILRLLKEIRIDEQTHLITNGSLLQNMGDDFWRELELIKVSIYPKLDRAIPELVREKSKEFGFMHEMTEFNEFFGQFKANPNDGVESFSHCHWKTDCYTVHKGVFYLCPQSAFSPKTIHGLDSAIDGISLDGITEEKLRSFMDRKEPLFSCRNCCANEMKKEPWREASRSQWVEQSMNSKTKN